MTGPEAQADNKLATARAGKNARRFIRVSEIVPHASCREACQLAMRSHWHFCAARRAGTLCAAPYPVAMSSVPLASDGSIWMRAGTKPDRKTVVSGKRLSVRVYIGGTRRLKQISI